ncbi:MAG: MBL fold metallo-hydrolase [Deltaproteobacteria bacterium]|nr:MBL fold metallo-hydrolase [Deltaproteobacteria bacterium]
MILEQLTVGPFQCNCSIIACEKTKEAIVLDPGEEAHRIEKILKDKDLKLKYLVHTHAHLDHVGATCDLQEHFKTARPQSCLHEEDQFLWDNVAMQAALFNLPPPKSGKVDLYIHEGDQLKFGELSLKVLHTPGHTPGSLCFILEEANQTHLFAGDTLFAGSIGRTDLWGGDYGTIIHSIKDKLLLLDDNTQVHAGHGPSTTIGIEKQHNPFL